MVLRICSKHAAHAKLARCYTHHAVAHDGYAPKGGMLSHVDPDLICEALCASIYAIQRLQHCKHIR